MIRLPEGGVLVADRRSLREYDENGTHVREWGGRGEGPGEFDFIGGLHRWGADSVVAWDRGLLRLTVFDTQGNLGRTARMHEAPQLILRGAIGHDQLVFERVVDFNTNESCVDRRSTTYGVPYPKKRQVLGAAQIQQADVVGVWESLVIAGPNDRYEIRAHGTHGSLERIIRLDRSPVSPDASHLRMLLEDDLDRERDIPMAPTLPMFDRVIGDDLGYLWVRDYDMPGEDTVLWTVFDAAGAVVTRPETSDRLRVWEIGRDYTVASQVGDLDGHPDGGDHVAR